MPVGMCSHFLVALLLLVGCGDRGPHLALPPGAEPVLAKVQARRLDIDLALYATVTDLENLLWNRFMESRRTKRFATVTAADWYAKQQYACEVLRRQALAAELDGESLERCLAAVLPGPDGGVAMVPVGAYLVANGSRQAWIIVCRWEYPPGRVPCVRPLHQVRAWALDAADASILAEMSCG